MLDPVVHGCAAAGVKSENTAPWGSVRLASVPTPGISVASISTWAPSSVARSTLGTLLELRRGRLTRHDAEQRGRLVLAGTAEIVVQLGRLLGWI